MSQLAKMLSPRRYLRARSIFERPWATNRRLSGRMGSKKPLTLKFRDGGEATFASARKWSGVMNWLLSAPGSPHPVTFRDGVLSFNALGHRVHLRAFSPGDPGSFNDLFVRDNYHVNALPAQLGTVVDLGANVGLFAMRIAARAERVVSIEPLPDNAELARVNIAAAQAKTPIEVLQMAVSRRSGETLNLYVCDSPVSPGGIGASLFEEHTGRWGETRHVPVQTISLDDLFAQKGIEKCGLLKCDVEGAEYDALLAASDATLARIDRMLVECHLTRPEWMPAFDELRARLAAAGFDVLYESLTKPDGQPATHVHLSCARMGLAPIRIGTL